MNPKAEVLMEAVASRPRARAFVEIGCLRELVESSTDGWSTIYLADEAKIRDGLLHSVDLNPRNIEVARQVVMNRGLSSVVRFHERAGADWLKEFAGPIDFLYLDGSDDAEVNLQEFKAAERKLSPRAVVCVDDCHNYLGRQLGKGDKVVPYATERGWTLRLVLTLHPWRTAILERAQAFDTTAV